MKTAFTFLLVAVTGWSALAQNVGIGTKTPFSRLHVTDSASNSIIQAQTIPGNSAAGQRLLTPNGTSDFTRFGPTAGSSTAGVPTDNLTRLYTSGGALLVGNADNTPFHFVTNNVERMRIQGDGNVGIGTVIPNPTSVLHVDAANSVTKGFLITGVYGGPSGSIPDLATGSRMMYYPGKAAFRAGYVIGDGWNNANVGLYSVALGNSPKATGLASTAFGSYGQAIGESSTALGDLCSSEGLGSVAMGVSNTAGGYGSIAMAVGTRARSFASTAMGYGNVAKGYAGTVMGVFNDSLLSVTESNGTANSPLLIIGNGIGDGSRSNAMVVQKSGNVGIGENFPTHLLDIKANSILGGRVQLRLHETDNDFARLRMTNNTTANGWDIAGAPQPVTADASLNFYYDGLGNNVLSLKGNGNAVLTGTLTQLSDARLKKNIQSITSSLPSLLQLNAYHYNWIDAKKDNALQTGLLAQEVQKVFPELVHKDEQGYLSVNYTGLVPLLLTAVKEQQQQLQELRTELQELKKSIQSLQRIKD